jgi:catechol 2,3-dioxygenase-like lactoylglutathione lyase family enzyme
MINLKINYLQHVGIPVTDMSISEAFYEKLGFQNVMPSTFEFNGEKGGIVAMMKQGDMIIELYQMPKTELAKIRKRKDGHIDHIAFDVDDIDATFVLLKENGFKILEEAPVFLSFWKKGCKYFNIEGPNGERLEFNQILK